MAYDKIRYDEIQQMGAGDLVHFMLTKHRPVPEWGDGAPYEQSTEYFWAYQRLNELLPAPSAVEPSEAPAAE